ncbi:hypothetical protein HAX54_031118, partial [Datura stramonium]|nr:hypothetical protein [Datura stramonium]
LVACRLCATGSLEKRLIHVIEENEREKEHLQYLTTIHQYKLYQSGMIRIETRSILSSKSGLI